MFNELKTEQFYFYSKNHETVLFIFRRFAFRFCFSQDETTDKNSLPTTVISFNTYGYIDGKRLDSVESLYANIGFRNDGFRSSGGITFDYGQIKGKNKEYLITDKRGVPLQFASTTLGSALNFFHYNHWEFLNYAISNTGASLLLKKQ